MKKKLRLFTFLIAPIFLSTCQSNTSEKEETKTEEPIVYEQGTFGYDLQFLQKHLNAVNLQSPDSQAQVVVVPEYQGRVMTSTSGGKGGNSYGWINYELIASGEVLPQLNPYGGEDRFWLGPEGGQYSIFFKAGSEFVLEQWETPAILDTEPFELTSQTQTSAIFEKSFSVTNYQNFTFDLAVEREIQLIDEAAADARLGVPIPDGVHMVGFESINRITNTSSQAWKEETGLLSIWTLGMFKPSPETVVIIPLDNKEGKEGAVVSDYFGEVPPERLTVTDSAAYFLGDGQERGKIGVPYWAATSLMGSYDSKNHILTVVTFTLPEPESMPQYVNSKWEYQENPYSGDVINSYNDGPAVPGGEPFGPFYELESSSPGAALAPNESLQHIHSTFHFSGDEAALKNLCQQLLGVDAASLSTVL